MRNWKQNDHHVMGQSGLLSIKLRTVLFKEVEMLLAIGLAPFFDLKN